MMLKIALLSVGMLAPGVALACGGAKADKSTTAATPSGEHATIADKDPAACAKKASLVGANCSYTTGMMAQRVLAEGKPWSFTGRFTSAGNALSSHVAAPFTLGPDGVNVVANEVLETVTEKGLADQRLSVDGKRLEVDGVTYFVLTGFEVPST